MKQQTGNTPSTAAGTTGSPIKQTVNGPNVGRPLDGSQYIEVIEEQEYADQRPSPEEQKPRFSYLHGGKPEDKKA